MDVPLSACMLKNTRGKTEKKRGENPPPSGNPQNNLPKATGKLHELVGNGIFPAPQEKTNEWNVKGYDFV